MKQLFQLSRIHREAAPLHINSIHSGEKSGFLCPIAKILTEIPKLCRQLLKFISFDLACLFRRKIFAGFHQPADTAFYLRPGQAQALFVIAGTFTAVDRKPVFIKPDRIWSAAYGKATPTGAELFA